MYLFPANRVAYVLISSSIIAIYFLLFNFPVINFIFYLGNQYHSKSLYYHLLWIDDSEVAAIFVNHDDSNEGHQVRLNRTLFLGKCDSLPFLIRTNISLCKLQTAQLMLLLSQDFRCNFRRFGCSQFFKGRRTFLTLVVTPDFSAITLEHYYALLSFSTVIEIF